MNRETISRRIQSILSDLTQVTGLLHAMDGTDMEKYPDNYTALAQDAALRSEQIACRMRHLLYASTAVRKAEYMACAGSVQGIRIRDADGVLQVTLPCLLPKKKQRQSAEFLTDPLYFALSQYADARVLPKYTHCVVCFCHIYAKTLPKGRIRDYDNVEMKQLLDVLATFLMLDDTGLLVDAYNTTELGETESTIICIMDKSRFPQWLQERENRLETISDF